MDKFKNLTLEDRINQMKEDYNNEWWRASKIDNFDLKNKVWVVYSKIMIKLLKYNFIYFLKLLRVGCRPLKRKLMKCQNRLATSDEYISCNELKADLMKCHETLYMVYYNSKKDEVIKK